MTVYYVSPSGAGDHSGSSWANAAVIGKIGAIADRAPAGSQILIRADQGSYHVTSQIAFHDGGDLLKPIVIRGVDGAGHAMQAVIVGDRPSKFRGDTSAGNELFKLLAGADNIQFKDLSVRDTGTVFRFGADASHIKIDNVDARNVAYFINDLASGASRSASLTALTIQNVDIVGFSKKAIVLQYDSHGVTIANVHADMAGQIGEAFPEGVHLRGTVHDVLISNSSMDNVQTKGRASVYWNGDGFATERGTRDIRFEHTSASGNSDAGYDLKSAHTVLHAASAEGNNRNFRIWQTAELNDVRGLATHHHGGNSQQSQVWIAHGANAIVRDSVFHDGNARTQIFSGTEGTIRFDDVDVYRSPASALFALYHSKAIDADEVSSHYLYAKATSGHSILPL